jgi:hypothetical protein
VGGLSPLNSCTLTSCVESWLGYSLFQNWRLVPRGWGGGGDTERFGNPGPEESLGKEVLFVSSHRLEKALVAAFRPSKASKLARRKTIQPPVKMASVPVYCLCRLPYDVTRFMIECDMCQDWFHGR